MKGVDSHSRYEGDDSHRNHVKERYDGAQALVSGLASLALFRFSNRRVAPMALATALGVYAIVCLKRKIDPDGTKWSALDWAGVVDKVLRIGSHFIQTEPNKGDDRSASASDSVKAREGREPGGWPLIQRSRGGLAPWPVGSGRVSSGSGGWQSYTLPSPAVSDSTTRIRRGGVHHEDAGARRLRFAESKGEDTGARRGFDWGGNVLAESDSDSDRE